MKPTRSTKRSRRPGAPPPAAGLGERRTACVAEASRPSGFSCPQRAQVSTGWKTRVHPDSEEVSWLRSRSIGARAEAFAGRMLDMLNGGALAVMISVGHRTGLFDALAELDGATSQELADAAGLDERYVREWLGAMTAGRIVELDPETARYSLPAEHAAWLTRAASPDNLAVEAQWITTLSTVEDDIVECFRERRRRAVRALRALPRGHGRGERADRALGALLAHPPARPRHGRATRGGRVAPRSRLRSRSRAPSCSPSASRRARSTATTSRRTRSRSRRRRRPSAGSRTSASSSAT